jgi:hypothetical protein
MNGAKVRIRPRPLSMPTYLPAMTADYARPGVSMTLEKSSSGIAGTPKLWRSPAMALRSFVATQLFSDDATNAGAFAPEAFASRRRAVQPTSPH